MNGFRGSFLAANSPWVIPGSTPKHSEFITHSGVSGSVSNCRDQGREVTGSQGVRVSNPLSSTISPSRSWCGLLLDSPRVTLVERRSRWRCSPL